MTYLNDQYQFYWIDLDFNLSHPHPFAKNFCSDPRNKDLAVNMAYAVKDFKKNDKIKKLNNYGNGEHEIVNLIKNSLGFPLPGTEFKNKLEVLPSPTPNVLLTRQQQVLMAN